MNELIISIPILILTSLIIYKINPRHCARCNHGTLFPILRHLQGKENYPVFQYCLKCYFYINLSSWKCENCKNMGTHRLHKLNFISRLLVIKSKQNVYKKCQCGERVELQCQ